MTLEFARRFGLRVAAAVVATAIGTGDADAGKARWKMRAAFGQTIAVIGPPPRRIAEAVGRMSDGDFRIRVFEPGALAGGYACYDPASPGAFEAAFGTPGANRGRNPAHAFLSTRLFGPAAPEFIAWFKQGGGIEIARDLHGGDNIRFIL